MRSLPQVLWSLPDPEADWFNRLQARFAPYGIPTPSLSSVPAQTCLGHNHMVQTHPPTLSTDFEWIVEPLDVMATHTNSDTGNLELLMQWKDLLEHEATWEALETIQQQMSPQG